MTVTLPPLPYSNDALEPYISEKTVQFHYGKHHNAYVVNTTKFITGTPMEDRSLEEIIKDSFNQADKVAIFNNAAQVWNHTFYWNGMKPGGGGNPSGPIADLLVSNFGNLETFSDQLKTMAMSQFGSGWAWLVQKDDDSLEIMKTLNADTPIAHGLKPLLTVDVWEHAYYLDYQNKRAEYLDNFLSHLVNWEYVNSQLR